jgi:hypothetical protein
MHITSLAAPAFKGRDVKLSLTQANLITADPFTGKTGATQALQIAMFGYVPGMGTGNKAVFEFATGELFTKITFSTGEENIVAITRTGENLTKDAKLAHKFPDVLMNFDEYLSKTEQQRLQYILDRADLKKTGYDEKKLLKELFAEKPDSADEEKALMIWSKSVDESIGQRQRTSSTVPFWMEALVGRLKARIKSLKTQIAQREQSIKALDAKEPEDVTEQREEAHKNLTQALAEAGEFGGIDSIDGQIKESDRRITVLRDAIGALEADEMKKKKLDHCPVCLARGKDWLKNWQKEHDAQVKEQSDQLKSERKNNARLVAERKEYVDSTKCDKHQEKIDGLQCDYDELDAKHTARAAWVTNQKQLKAEKNQLALERAEMTVVKTLTDKLVEYQQKLVHKAIGALLTSARHFCDGLLLSPLVYHNGEIGRYEHTQWIPARVGLFSGTEHLIAFAGLQIALAQESPCKIVILDELGRMPVAWKRKVAERMLSLVKGGDIDQFILVDCESSWLSGQLAKSINLIEL